MRVGVSFHYVGDMTRARSMYERLFAKAPEHGDDIWVQFQLDETTFALHLDPALAAEGSATEGGSLAGARNGGAVVSFYEAEGFEAALERAIAAGFRQLGAVTDQPFGKLANLVDPWGNRFSVIRPSA